MSENKMVLLIDNVHMGQGHAGLTALAKRFRKDPAKLNAGEVLVFVNRGRNKMKIMGAGGVVLGYLRLPEGKLKMEHLHMIPRVFGGSAVNATALQYHKFNKALSGGAKEKKPYSIFGSKAAANVTAMEANKQPL